jgi:pimeloyl-ACP methyl ester carboxylesterase
MRETAVSADGTPLAMWRSGEGPPLVLVHGAAADHSRWAPVLPALEEHFTVHQFDRRGRAESGDAALLTDRIRKLVLYEPPLGFVAAPPHVVAELEALLQAGKRDELVAVFLRDVAGAPPEQIELMRSLPAWEARVAAADTIPREERANREYAWDPDRFRELSVPTVYLLGGDSAEPFRLAAEAVEAALPDCQVVVMPGQRHAAMDTGTELFVREVLSFLGDP